MVIVNDATICAGNSVVITPTGADTYSISGNSFTVTPASTTTYSITGASNNGCGAPNSAIATIYVNANPTVTVNSATICSGSSVVIVPGGATTYTISGNSFTVNPTSNSSYSVTGTDANGCISSEAVSSVTVNALPLVTAGTSNATVCINTTATLTAGGAVSYSWSSTQTASTVVITPTVSGSETYTVTGTDANGCINTAMVTQAADNCTAIKTNANATLIFGVYPNPNTGRFTVETGENVQITVLNSIGQTVHTETTSGTKTNISIENLANGIYFIKAVAGGNQHVVKIVKD
jgi:predicted secreted protein